MAIILQRNHFERIPFDDALSQKILKGFIDSLDAEKLYFYKSDIERFQKTYGNELDDLILKKRSMIPAMDVFEIFRKRVRERVAYAEGLLKEANFDFSIDEEIVIDRENLGFPADLEEANNLWKLEIKKSVLTEILRRKAIAKAAADQGKENPLKEEAEPAEKVLNRYQRFLNAHEGDDSEDMANYFLSAVARTYDPHTEYFSAREMDRFTSSMSNSLVGIGAMLRAEDDGATKIEGIVVNGPADKAGDLQLKDRVVGVDPLNNGEMIDIMYMRIDKVVELIRGKESTEVALKIEPANAPPGETKIIIIERDRVELKDEVATAELLIMNEGVEEKRVGYIKLPSFYADFEKETTRASVDIEKLLKRLVKEKIDGLVFDVRNNGGGSLEEVRRMTGFFINRGPVVQIKDASGRKDHKESSNKKPIYTGPMVVLSGKTSASASEILAGALQDYNRAVVVGDSSSFGKGTVQQMMDIGRKMPLFADRQRAGFLKPTIQKFYRVSGSSTQLQGVVPDIVLPSLFDSLEIGEQYMDNALPHDMIAKAPGFKALNRDRLYLESLRERSIERVKSSQDFSYIQEDVKRLSTEKEENTVSLNMEKRLSEIREADERRKARHSEQRERFAKIAEEDLKNLKIFRVSLDVNDGDELKLLDQDAEDSEYMRKAKQEIADLDDSPKWPSGIDPVKREGIKIVSDLISLTEKAKVAGVLPSEKIAN